MRKMMLGKLSWIGAFIAAAVLACAFSLVVSSAAFAVEGAVTNESAGGASVGSKTGVTVEIEGMAYLMGRDWGSDEEFAFQLKGLNGAPMPEGANGDTLEFAVARTDVSLKIGVFGQFVTFNEPGTYVYELSQVPGDAPCVVYDEYVSTITVEVVVDENTGKLSAEKSVETRMDITAEAGVSCFLNKYKTSMGYPGFSLTKTLEGRDMNSGEFAFTVVAENPYAHQKGIAQRDNPLVFESGAHASGEVCTMPGVLTDLTFNQDDSNHEFIYLVEEVLPADDDPVLDGVQQNGVTYDEAQYRVVIRPTDDGKGHIGVTTEVYDINDDLRENLLSFGSSDEGTTAVVPFANEYGSDDADSAGPADPADPDDPAEPSDPADPTPGDASASEGGVADGNDDAGNAKGGIVNGAGGVKGEGGSEASFAKTNDGTGMLAGASAAAICAAAAVAALSWKRRRCSF